MTGRTHDLAAATALTICAVTFPPHALTAGTLVVGFLANQLGGIAPDIDQPTAPFWRNLPIGGIVGRSFTRLLGGHRFLSHSLIGAALLAAGAWALLQALHPVMGRIDIVIVWQAFMIGVASHLVMDSFTKEGVPWLLPLPVKFGFPPLKAWRLTTGHLMETLVVFPLLVGIDIWYLLVHYRQLIELLHHRIVS